MTIKNNLNFFLRNLDLKLKNIIKKLYHKMYNVFWKIIAIC